MPRSYFPARLVAAVVAAVLVLAGLVLANTHGSVAPAAVTTIPKVTPVAKPHAASHASGIAPGVVLTHIPRALSSTCPLTLARHHLPQRGRRHCTILEIGDSIGIDLGWGLQSELTNQNWVTFIPAGKVSTGLSNAWFYNWPREVDRMISLDHPDVVIICLGANDVRNLFLNSKYDAFATPAWHTTYAHLIRQLVSVATSRGSAVVWVPPPVMPASSYDNGVHLIGDVASETLKGMANTVYLPARSVLATSTGQFRATGTVNGVSTSLRSGDGLHLTYQGALVMATFVVRQLALIFHYPLSAHTPALLAP